MPGSEERSRSLFGLLSDLPAMVVRTVKAEIELAKADLRDRLVQAKVVAIFFGIAAALALVAVVILVVAGVFALALVVPGWLAALIVAVFLLLLAGIFVMVALPKMQGLTDPPRRPSASAERAARRQLGIKEPVVPKKSEDQAAPPASAASPKPNPWKEPQR